jgi:hypothetical protein
MFLFRIHRALLPDPIPDLHPNALGKRALEAPVWTSKGATCALDALGYLFIVSNGALKGASPRTASAHAQ